MIIGTFTFDKKADTYNGAICTLIMDYCGIQFRPIAKSSEKEPDYQIIAELPQGGAMEFGAAWKRTSDKGQAFLSVSIDDPGLVAPLNAALFPSENGKTAALVWNRPKKTAKPA